MESIRTNLSVDNIKNLSNFKIKNSSITNNSKIKNINDISTSLIENIDVSLDNVDNREKINIIDDLTEKYDLTEEQKKYLDNIFNTTTNGLNNLFSIFSENKKLKEKFKEKIEILLEQDMLAAKEEGREFTFKDLVISLTGKRNTTIAYVAAKSNMDLAELSKIYDLVDKNGMTLDYGTVTSSDGWYTGDFNYNGLYAKYEGDNGFSYLIALNKIDQTDEGIVYSSYNDEELTRYVEGCNSYIEHTKDIINDDLTDFFKSQVSSFHIKDSDGNIPICIVDVSTDGVKEWSGITCYLHDSTRYYSGTAIQGSSILDIYDPANGKIITDDSRIVGTFIHELGHSFDKSFIYSALIPASLTDEWVNIYPQVVSYMKEIAATSVDDGDPRVQLGDSVESIISYSDQIVNATSEEEIEDLTAEIFTEMNRLYYQDPATLQALEIDYTNEETGAYFDNLYDFMEALENGRLNYQEEE